MFAPRPAARAALSICAACLWVAGTGTYAAPRATSSGVRASPLAASTRAGASSLEVNAATEARSWPARLALPDGRECEVERQRLALRIATPQLLADLLADEHFCGARAQPWPIASWWLVELAPGCAIEPAYERARTGPEGAFVAPVLRGAFGPVFFSSHVLAAVPPELGAQQREQLLARAPGLRVLANDWAGMPGALQLASAERGGLEVLAQAALLAADERVLHALPDAIFTGRAARAGGDPLFAQSWALLHRGQFGGPLGTDLNAVFAWAHTTGLPSVHVGLIDDGIELAHPDLMLAPGADFTGQGGNGAALGACDSHGTSVAGCISAALDNGIGSAGIAPGARVRSLRALIALPACDGTWTSQESWTVEALAAAAASGVRVTCNPNSYGWTSAAIAQQYALTRAAGLVHLASAGNAGALAVDWPASLPEVLAVGACGPDGAPAPDSNQGAELDFLAPGHSIWTTDRSGSAGYAAQEHALLDGSSYACGFAAGVAALALARDPLLQPPQLEALLSASCSDVLAPGRDAQSGAGLLDAWAVVRGAAAAGATELVHASSLGVPGTDASYYPSLSDDGRYAAFDSTAPNLVTGDTNGGVDGFVRDRWTGRTTRVTVSSSGMQANGPAGDVLISADGRFIAFDSSATNLVPGDGNGQYDAFVHERASGLTELVSLAQGGALGNGASFNPSISGDGRFVAFRSKATNLVPLDTNAADDVFVRDRLLGTTRRISVDSAGVQGNQRSIVGGIAADGSLVSFWSIATNLVPADTNGVGDVFVHRLADAVTARASLAHDGSEANGASINPMPSADGQRISFESLASNLVAGDTNGHSDVFVRELGSAHTLLVSRGLAGAPANGPSSHASISGDGRFVAFYSDASNLVPNDANGARDAFLCELASGTIELLSQSSSGAQGSGLSGSSLCWLSRDGGLAVFESALAGLVPEDAHAGHDGYARVRAAPTSWWDVGSAAPSAASAPQLRALGGFASGTATRFELVDAPPGAPGALVLGASALHLPLLGGTLVPSPDFVRPFFCDAQGRALVAQSWPALPAALEGYAQAWVLDASGSQGFAASNAVAAKAP
jgi:Tol biopolymer transport system component